MPSRQRKTSKGSIGNRAGCGWCPLSFFFASGGRRPERQGYERRKIGVRRYGPVGSSSAPRDWPRKNGEDRPEWGIHV
jgi:hypothetical protein